MNQRRILLGVIGRPHGVRGLVHVLSHTIGLPNWRHEPGPLAPASEPGEAYGYSGEGFFYLQRVIERVSLDRHPNPWHAGASRSTSPSW